MTFREEGIRCAAFYLFTTSSSSSGLSLIVPIREGLLVKELISNVEEEYLLYDLLSPMEY